MPTPILETRNLCKSFGAVQAVRDVSLSLLQGEVYALVGDNGAGKSSLIKLLSGVYAPTSGEIWLRGERCVLRSPQDALARGIAPVYQDLALLEHRNVVMNIFLGIELTHGPLNLILDHRRMALEAQRVLLEMRSRIPSVFEPVRKLSGGQRQAVAIGRTLIRQGEIIILDEPTAALGVEQTGEVLALIERLREAGKTVILITHNMSHVMQVADQVGVMHRGELVHSGRTADLDERELVARIMGWKPNSTEPEAA